MASKPPPSRVASAAAVSSGGDGGWCIFGHGAKHQTFTLCDVPFRGQEPCVKSSLTHRLVCQIL